MTYDVFGGTLNLAQSINLLAFVLSSGILCIFCMFILWLQILTINEAINRKNLTIKIVLKD